LMHLNEVLKDSAAKWLRDHNPGSGHDHPIWLANCKLSPYVQNGRIEREILHLSLGKQLMMATLNSIICLSSSAAVLILSKTGSATETSEPLIVLMTAALAEKEGGPSASSSSGDACEIMRRRRGCLFLAPNGQWTGTVAFSVWGKECVDCPACQGCNRLKLGLEVYDL
jgi:hypothetical protein